MLKSFLARIFRPSLRHWLFYAETAAIIGFVLLAAFLLRGGEPEPPPLLSQVDTFIEKADAAFEQQYLARAAFLYWQVLQAVESTPENAFPSTQFPNNDTVRVHANLRLAEIYSQSNWLKDAKARLEYAERIQPEHEGVRLLRGKLFRDEGLPTEAAAEFLAVLEKKPQNAEAHYLLGVLYQGSKQFTEAAARYQQAIESDTDFQEISSEKAPIGVLARLQLSRTYRRMLQDYRFLDRELTTADMEEIGRLEAESVLLLEEAIAKRPEMIEVKESLIGLLFARARALEREAETRPYADALEVYERIVRLEPGEVRAWERMGEIYAGFLDDKASALEMYRKVYELEPHPIVLANVKSLEEDVANQAE